MALRIGYLASELGTVTSTFVYREISAVRALGAEVFTYSTTRPRGNVISAEARALVEATEYLYDVPSSAIVRAGVAQFFHAPGRFAAAKTRALLDALTVQVSDRKDRLKLIWHFTVACHLAGLLERDKVEHLHAHFAHVPAAVAMYAAKMAGISYSFTAHANDIFERPVALTQKVSRAAFVACISEYNVRHLMTQGCDPARLHVIHCGIDIARFEYRKPWMPGSQPHVVSVGRFVEKKGFGDLVEALRQLRDRGQSFRCTIAGDGPLLETIRDQIKEAHLDNQMLLPGPLPQEEVQALLREADVLALPCVVAESGDRDGIPVVLMEAMALGVPVVSTTVSGIPELITSGQNGLLGTPNAPETLANALEKVLGDTDLARSMARAARATIETEFNVDENAAKLYKQFSKAIHGTRE